MAVILATQEVGLKPAQANSMGDPIWKTKIHSKGLVEWLKV
jgi:hypothetical protein